REPELPRLFTEPLDLVSRGIGLQQRVVDERGDIARNFLSRVEAKARGARIDHPANAIGAAVVQHRVTLARARPLPGQRGRHFFGDDSLKVTPLHLYPRSSSARIFASLRI